MSEITANQVVSAIFGDIDDSAAAVDHVFAVLEATYGPAWTRSMGTAPIGTIKTVWAFQLGQFTHSQKAKRAILWALQNLPDTAPSPIQFRNLCRLSPVIEPLALPAPKADPVRMAKELEKIAHITKPSSNPHGMKAWAHRLRAMEKGGHKLSGYQAMCVNAAIGEAA